MMSKSCSADLHPWSVVSRRPLNLSVSRRPSPSASSRTRSSHSERLERRILEVFEESDLKEAQESSHHTITPRYAVLPESDLGAE